MGYKTLWKILSGGKMPFFFNPCKPCCYYPSTSTPCCSNVPYKLCATINTADGVAASLTGTQITLWNISSSGWKGHAERAASCLSYALDGLSSGGKITRGEMACSGNIGCSGWSFELTDYPGGTGSRIRGFGYATGCYCGGADFRADFPITSASPVWNANVTVRWSSCYSDCCDTPDTLYVMDYSLINKVGQLTKDDFNSYTGTLNGNPLEFRCSGHLGDWIYKYNNGSWQTDYNGSNSSGCDKRSFCNPLKSLIVGNGSLTGDTFYVVDAYQTGHFLWNCCSTPIPTGIFFNYTIQSGGATSCSHTASFPMSYNPATENWQKAGALPGCSGIGPTASGTFSVKYPIGCGITSGIFLRTGTTQSEYGIHLVSCDPFYASGNISIAGNPIDNAFFGSVNLLVELTA